jgi:hypothetical protein
MMQTPIKASKTAIATRGNSGLGYYYAQAIAFISVNGSMA